MIPSLFPSLRVGYRLLDSDAGTVSVCSPTAETIVSIPSTGLKVTLQP
jgi:hypothetical protein